jgi:hypothetical protein
LRRRDDGIELCGIHGATRQYPLALQFRRGRRHHDGIVSLFAASRVEQRPSTTTGVSI